MYLEDEERCVVSQEYHDSDAEESTVQPVVLENYWIIT